ncbi:MAG: hypothetical protein U9M96_02410 [Thermodesulfobacteriota bacterium]|nr:hypothetical protein [Thermodesulfobacteriota bacterium]
MENLSRNVDRKKRMMGQNKKRGEKSWTILVIGDKERIRSFEITKAFIVISLIIALGFLIGIPAAWWFQDRVQIPTQTEFVEKLKNAQNTLKITKEENRGLKARVQILKDELILAKQKLEKPLKEKRLPKVTPSTDTKTHILQAEKELPVLETVDKPHTVAIENFKTTINRTNNTCTFNFILRNKSEGKIAISGHIFVILKPDSSDIESWRVYPRTTLKNAKPHNFKRGERFSISRFRPIKGKIRKIPAQENYDSVSILVFSNDGNLILEEDIDLKTLTE